MPLAPPSESEEKEIIASLCHDKNAGTDTFRFFLNSYITTVCPDFRPDHAVPISSALAPTSHRATLEACAHIKDCPTKTRTQCEDDLYHDAGETERRHLTGVLMKLCFMVDCDSRSNFSSSFTRQGDDAFPTVWLGGQTLLEFLKSTFPADMNPLAVRFLDTKGLKAWKLRKRYKIRLSPTDDLAQHLVYNPTSRTISVFRQIAYLKAQIRRSSGLDLLAPPSASIPHGTLPPQLLVETLYTVHFILLPLFRDTKSHRLATKLVNRRAKPNRERFDPSLLIYDGLIHPMVDVRSFELVFWAKRVRELRAIVDNPPPAYKVISWIERHTSERNALTVALVGIFLAVLFGLLGLLVGVAQLVVSILAWKYPVTSG